MGAIEVRVWRILCRMENLRAIYQQGGIEVGCYRSRGLERIVLFGDIEAWGLSQYGPIDVCVWKRKDCSGGRAFGGFRKREL